MQRHTLIKMFFAGAAALWLAISTPVFGQGVTTSALNGFVTDKQDKPIGGATVTVVQETTGTHATTTTRANGQYNLSGLQPGGPYTVTVLPANGEPLSQKDVYLDLDQSRTVNFGGAADVVRMQAFVVEGSKESTFNAGQMGTGSSFSAEQIASIASIRRDPQDIANLDPRINLLQYSNGSYEYQMSAQGQNYRYNSFLIDGVQANDPFGLNNNGYAGLRSPIPPEWIAALNIEVNPYDLANNGFTGARSNVVLKSGTNDFHGSVYTNYTGTRLRGPNPVNGLHEPRQDHDFGFTSGGPIIPNKLFYFVGYDSFRSTVAPPTQNFNPNDNPTDAAVVQQIITKAQSYGYDSGTMNAGSTITKQQSFLAKIDWNISDTQKVTVTWRRNAGQTPNFADYTGTTTTSFSNHWYQVNRINDSFVVKVNSDWSAFIPNLRTEASGAFSRYNGSAKPNGTPFPEVAVGGISGTELNGVTTSSGFIYLGTNYSYQVNSLFTKNYDGHLYGEYSWGNHTFKFGGDSNKTQYNNAFIQYAYGSYSFYNVADWVAATPTGITLATASTGFALGQAIAHWSLTDFGALFQDTWRPNERFTLLAGLRFDDPYVPGKPPFSQSFTNAFGFRNDTGFSGNYAIAPRVAFNYSLPGTRKTQIRGGVGLFQGTNPAVWLSNAFSNTGAVSRASIGNSAAVIPNYTFTANPNAQPLPPTSSAPPLPVYNVTDPNFKWPSSWKANLALDHQLPFLGLIFTAEINEILVNKALFYESLNIKAGTTAAMPDSRNHYAGNIYPGYNTGVSNVGGVSIPTGATSGSGASLQANPSFSNVMYLTNTNQGGAQDYSLALKRPMKDHWAASLAYTHSHATEVDALTSSVATSNYNNQVTTNPNENIARPTDNTVPDKVVLTMSREFNFFKSKNALTTFSMQYIAQTGHPYSYAFKGDANGDGIQGNDAFYVPTGPNDPKVVWANPAEQTAFFQFLANTPELAKWSGQIAPRNSEFASWAKLFNVHVEQQIPLYRRARMSAFMDIFNFGNLLSKKWGQVALYDFPYSRTIAGAAYNAAGNGGQGQYIYFFNSNTLGQLAIYTDSRWQIQVGAKIEF